MVVVPGAWLAMLLWPRIWRLLQLRRRNQELERERGELRRSIQERSLDVLKTWRGPEEPN